MTYLGYDVLELNYDRLAAVEERTTRKAVLLDPGTGKRTSDEQAPSGAGVRPFTWTAFGRAEIAQVRAFLEARKGMAVPFWLPSLQWDLTLAEDVEEDATIATIEWVRYVQQMFGTTGARRHIALWALGNSSMIDAYQVVDATDPNDGETESLTLSPAAVRDYNAAKTVVSFLKFCRLEDDLADVSYLSGNVARATIRVRELPLEAPA